MTETPPEPGPRRTRKVAALFEAAIASYCEQELQKARACTPPAAPQWARQGWPWYPTASTTTAAGQHQCTPPGRGQLRTPNTAPESGLTIWLWRCDCGRAWALKENRPRIVSPATHTGPRGWMQRWPLIWGARARNATERDLR